MSRFWQHFLNNGRPGQLPAYLGLQGYAVPLTRKLALRFQLAQATGVAIQTIDPASPADDAGLLEADILLSLADQPTATADDLNRLLVDLPTDHPIRVVFLRGDRCLERLALLRSSSRPVKRQA